jgi:membrane-associated phospholipid phosphatase
LKKYLVWLLLSIIIITPFTPWLDVAVAKAFYRNGSFVRNNFTHFIFCYGPWPALAVSIVSLGIFCLSFFIDSWRKWQTQALLLVLTMVVGSGLMVHGLKDTWGRPRPVQVKQFGGHQQFRPFYQPNFSSGDEKLKSFPCGHASTGFFFLSFCAIGVRKNNRLLVVLGIILSMTLGGMLSAVRVMEGKHFFSDIVISLLVMSVSVVFLDWLIYQKIYAK